MIFGHMSFVKRIVAAVVGVMFFVQIAHVSAALATPASDRLSRQQVGVAADHEIVFLSPSGINSAADTITIDLSDFTQGSIGANDVAVSWGASTGFEHTSSVAAVAGVGIWGASFAGGTLTLTAPTDAATVSSIAGGQKIGILIGTNAGGSDQLTNPASAGPAVIVIGGTFGDSNTVSVPILSSDAVNVTATVVATSSSPGGGGGGGGSNPSAPVLFNIQAVNITADSATITWLTDLSADSSVSYGLTVLYASGTVSDAAQVISHSLNLAGLTASTTYHFQVRSLNSSSGLSGVSGDYTFTTLGAGNNVVPVPLVISNVSVVNITDSSALVTWSTNKSASSLVQFGMTAAYGQMASSPGFVTSHSVPLNGLLAGTAYHFSVLSNDGGSDTATSSDLVFVTSGDITPPANVINFSVTPGDGINALNWTLPPDVDFAGVSIRRTVGAFPTGPFDGAMVYDGSGVNTVDVGLTNGTIYYYAAYAYDAQGNFASGALAQGTPVGPVINNPPTSTPPVPPTSTPPVQPNPPAI